MVNWTLVVSILTLAINVVYFVRIVYLMELTHELQSYAHLHAEYVGHDMTESFRVIRKLHGDITKGSFSLCQYKNALVQDDEAARPLEEARQRVVDWYERVVYYHKHNLLEPHAFDTLPGPHRTAKFLAHFEPLTLASCQVDGIPNCHVLFDYLRNLYKLAPRQTLPCVDVDGDDDEQVINNGNKATDTKDEL